MFKCLITIKNEVNDLLFLGSGGTQVGVVMHMGYQNKT